MLFWEEDNVPDRASYNLAPEDAAVECSGITTTNKSVNPDSFLLELRDAMRKQEEKLEGLAQQVARLQVSEGRRGRRSRQEPRYDSAGRPICFRCQGVGHIARFCSNVNTVGDDGRQLTPSEVARGTVVQTTMQQGNEFPLQLRARLQEGNSWAQVISPIHGKKYSMHLQDLLQLWMCIWGEYVFHL